MSKQEFVANIRINALLDDAKKELSAFGDAFDKMWSNTDKPKKLTRELENLKASLASMQEIAKKGSVNTSDLSRAESDYKDFKKNIHNLKVEFGLFTAEQKKALLGTKEQENIAARAKAIEKYTQALKQNEEVLKKRAPLENSRQQLVTKGKALSTLQQDTTDRLNRVKARGPILSKKAKTYVQNSREAENIKKLIQTAEESLAKNIAKGEKKDGALITRITAQLGELKDKLKAIDTETGKLDYEQEISKHKQVITELENSLEQNKEAITNNNLALRETEKELKALKTLDPAKEFEELKQTLKSLGVEEAESAKDLKELEKIVQKLESGALKRVDAGFNDMSRSLDNLSVHADKAKTEIDATRESMQKASEAAAEREAFEAKIKQFLGFAGAAQVLRKAVRDAISTITELDATMTEMAVVTDLTVGDYWDQLPEYSARASELGVSINAAYRAATLYYQQGLKTNEVNAISVQTLKMAKIAGMDATDATNKMTAALRGFNMELNEVSAQKVADVYSQLAAITAADTKEIANAMTKTASIASSAGMEFETTAAFLSQIIETTRESAETAGTAMKTVIARFQELKKSPDEIGEIDGEIVDANAIETALRSVGVSLRDAKGQFRDLDDVFLELSSKWDTLDKNTQRYIATIAAGSRQQSRFIAMMSDYARTQELVTQANTSAGASQKQFEKTMESLEAKIERLKNAWHEFAMGILNSDLVKLGIDILTKFLELVNKATNAFNGLGDSIAKIASVIMVFKVGQKIFDKLKAPLTDYFKEIIQGARETGEKAGDAAKEGLDASRQKGDRQEVSKKTKKLSAYARQALDTTKKKTAKDIPATIVEHGVKPLQTAQKGVGAAVQYGRDRKRLKELKQKFSAGEVLTVEELREKEALTKQNQETNQALKNKAYSAANFLTGGGLSEAKTSHEEARKSYAEMMNKRDVLGAAKKGLEGQNEKIDTLKNNDLANLEKEKQLQNQIAKDSKKSEEERIKAQKKISSLNGKILNVKKKIKKEEESLSLQQTEYAKLEDEYVASSEEYVQNQSQMWDNIGTSISNAGQKIAGVGVAASMLGGIFEELGLTELGEAFSTVGQYVTVFGSSLMAIGPMVSTFGKTAMGWSLKLQAAGWSTQMAWIWIVAIIAAVVALIALVAIMFNNIKNSSPEAKLEAAQGAAEEAAKAADEAAQAYENLANALDGLEDKYDGLKDLVSQTKEWNEAVKEINSSVLNLISEYPELARLITRDNGVLRIDLQSQDVKDILSKYEQEKIYAQAQETRAQVEVSKAQQTVDFGSLEAVKKVGARRALIQGTATAEATAWLPGANFAYGGLAAYNASTKTKSDETLQNAVAALTKSVQEGKTPMHASDMQAFLEQQNVAAGEAKIMAEAFAKDTQALLEYGEALNTYKAQQDAYYDAIAMQAQSLVNMTGWTESEKAIATATVTGEDIQRYEKKLEEDYLAKNKNWFFHDKDDSTEVENELRKYMSQTLGASDIKIRDNKIVYIDKEGQKQKVDKQKFLEKMISQKATEQAAAAMQASREAVSGVKGSASAKLTNKGYEQSSVNTAIEHLFENEDGKNLTSGEAKMLGKLTEDDYKEMYAQNKEGLEALYGSEKEFIEAMQGAITKADDSFEKAKKIQDKINQGQNDQLEIVQGFMSSGQAETFATKMEEVFIKSGTEGATTLVDNFNSALKGKTEEEQQRIEDVINAYDWSNADELDKLYLQLWQTYDIGEQEAKSLVQAIKNGNYAISSLATTINQFDAFAQAQYELQESTNKLAELQHQYNIALEEGADVLTELMDQMAAEHQRRYNLYKNEYEGALVRFTQTFASRADKDKYGYDLSDLITLKTDEKTGEIIGLDTSKLADHTTLANNENVQALVEELWNSLNDMESAKEGQRNEENAFRELNKANQDSYKELSRTVADTIISEREKEIDALNRINDSVNSANEKLISKMQEQIDEDRQERANQETEKNLQDLYNQRALLGASGGNATALLDLDKQISQAEQDYQDSLVDQALQNLQDANDKAAEQRERQITLQESMLEEYQKSDKFQKDIEDALQTLLGSENPMSTAIGQAIIENGSMGLTDAERQEYSDGFNAMVLQAKKAEEGGYTLDANGNVIVGAQGSTVNADAQTLAETQRRGALSDKGFTLATDSKTVSTEQLGTIEKFLESNNEASLVSKATAAKSKLDRAVAGGYRKDEPMTELDYYEEYQQGILAGTHKQTYNEYLIAEAEKLGEFENLTAMEAFGGHAVNGSRKHLWKWAEDQDFNVSIEGHDDAIVDLGKKATSDLADRLEYIDQQTGPTGYVYIDKKYAHTAEDVIYMRESASSWWPIKNDGKDWSKATDDGAVLPDGLRAAALKAIQAKDQKKYNKKEFKTGGLADFTGPAWLDGTPSRPEYVLNAKQTERFFSLVDVLESFNSHGSNQKTSGDNYFDIAINVEKLDNDYDVEQIANKIRRMIYDDATYRNVNTINHLR